MPFNDSGLRALGVNAKNPPDMTWHRVDPTQNDYIMFDPGHLWYVDYGTSPNTWSLWYLASKANMIATWLKIFTGTGGNAITNLIDDNGNIVTPDLTTNGITVHGGANINTDGSVPHIITVNLDTSILQPMTNAAGTTGIYALGTTDYITDRFMHAWGTASTYLGYQAGPNPSLGVGSTGNVGIGLSALTNITSAGHDNIAIGHGSMGNSISSTGCVCVGANAGSAITTSLDCIFLGVNAGNVITTGSYNIFLNAGHTVDTFPLPANTSNTLYIGSQTGTNLYELNAAYICGIYNTASGVGYLGTAPKMVAIGSDDKITSSPNIYMPSTTATTGQIIQNGYCVWSDYGTNNLFIGGGGNFTMSAYAGENVGIGPNCLTHLVGTSPGDAGGNVCVGSYSGDFLTDGNGNTLIGHQTGGTYLTGLTGGDNNTIVGSSCGYNYTGNESNNILIGGLVGGTVGESNTLQIGNATGSSFGNINKTYICGIRTTTATPQANALVTLVDTNDLLYGLTNQTIGYVLTSNGPSNAPTWQIAGGGGGGGIVTLTGDTGSTTAASTIQIAGGNNITTSASGGILTVNVSGTTNHALQCGNVGGSLTSLVVGTTGKYLRAATTANPTWSTLTLPNTVALGDVLVASSTNVVDVVNNVANAGYVLTVNVGAAPSFQALPASAVTSVSGTTNQITVSPTTGATVVSLVTSPTVTGTWTTTAGNLSLPITSSTAGQITQGGSSIFHTYGLNNVFIGDSSGNFTLNPIVAEGNTGLGQFTLNSLSTGSANIAAGRQSLGLITTGTNNAAFGYIAGYNTTTGSYNIYFGSQSGYTSNIPLTGNYNILIGFTSGSNFTGAESSNIYIGANLIGVAGESNTLRIGNGAGTSDGQINKVYIANAYSNYGTGNTFIGETAGNFTFNTLYTKYNTGVGTNCMQDIAGTIGSNASNNVGYGYNSLYALTTGGNNSAYGQSSLGSLTTGNYNCIFGRLAASSYIGAESSNIIIGYTVSGVAGEDNTLRIGNATGASTGNINAAYITGITGKTSTSGAAVYCNSSNKLGTSTSSIRYKEDVKDMTDTSDIIAKLRPVTFKFKEDTLPKPLQYGLIAEEVEPIWPEMVIYGPDGLPQNLAYQFLAPILLKEIQSLRKRIEQLEAR